MNAYTPSVARPFTRVLWFIVPALVVAGAAACNKVTDPSKNTVETFSGTLAPGASAVFNFTSRNNGEYAITVKSLTPDSNMPVGVGFGLQGGGQCNLINANSPVGVGYGLAGAINRGDYCAIIYDLGVFTQSENFTMTVSHP